MFELALAAGWGILLGGINHWILTRPIRNDLAANHDAVFIRQALMKKMYARFLLRMLVSFTGIGLAFAFWQDMIPVAVTLLGLFAVNMLMLLQQRRRRSTV